MAEQTRTNRRTGEVQALRNGQWVTIQPGRAMGMPGQVGPAIGGNPLLPGQVTAQGLDITGKTLDNQIKGAEAPYAASTAQANAAAAQAAAELKRLEIEQQRIKNEEAKRGDEKDQDRKQKAELLNTTTDKLLGLYGNYLTNYQGKGPQSLVESLPDSLSGRNSGFNADAAGLSSLAKPYTRTAGEGPQSDVDFLQFLAANQPQAQAKDEANEARFDTMIGRMNALRRANGLPEIDFEAEARKRAEGPKAGMPADRMAPSKGGTKSEIDPARRAVAARIGAMIRDGAKPEQVLEFGYKNGISRDDQTFQDTIKDAFGYRNSPKWRQYQQAKPGAPYPIDPGFYTREIKLSPAASALNSAAQNPLGAAVGAFGNAAAGNQFANITDAVGGNGEQIRTNLQAMRTENPIMSFLGDMAGQAAFQAVGSRVPGLRAMPNSRIGRIGEDVLFNGISGSGDGLGNAAMAAGGGAAGGMFGRGLGRATGGALRGVQDANLGYLNRNGVDLTIGDIGAAAERNGNPLGGFVARSEERLSRLPVFENIVNPARQRFDVTTNLAAGRQAVAPGMQIPGSGITAPNSTGSALVSDLADARSQAYGFLDNVNLPPDARYAGTAAGIRANIPGMPAQGNVVGAALDQVDRSFNPNLSGREWQDGIRAIRQDRSTLAGQPGSRQAIQGLTDAEDNLFDLASRQGPPGTGMNLQRANALNANAETIVRALDNGPTQARDELFSMPRLDQAARDGARQFQGRWSSMQGNRPFYELTTAGRAVRPNLTRDSGTAGNALFTAGLTGAGLGGVTGLGAAGASEDINALEGGGFGTAGGAAALGLPTLALAALYSGKGQRGIQKALLGDRPRIDVIEKAIAKNPVLRRMINKRASGMFGSSLARDYYAQDELDYPY